VSESIELTSMVRLRRSPSPSPSPSPIPELSPQTVGQRSLGGMSVDQVLGAAIIQEEDKIQPLLTSTYNNRHDPVEVPEEMYHSFMRRFNLEDAENTQEISARCLSGVKLRNVDLLMVATGFVAGGIGGAVCSFGLGLGAYESIALILSMCTVFGFVVAIGVCCVIKQHSLLLGNSN